MGMLSTWEALRAHCQREANTAGEETQKGAKQRLQTVLIFKASTRVGAAYSGMRLSVSRACVSASPEHRLALRTRRLFSAVTPLNTPHPPAFSDNLPFPPNSSQSPTNPGLWATSATDYANGFGGESGTTACASTRAQPSVPRRGEET